MTGITNITCRCHARGKSYEADAARGLDAALNYLATAGVTSNAAAAAIAKEAGEIYDSGVTLDKRALPRACAIWEGAEHAAWKAATEGWHAPGEADVHLEITAWE